MTSKNIYTQFISNQYCVYHTIYSGNLMPPNYIGSSSVDRVLNKNYHGSVKSKKYKAIWKLELKLHPELFTTIIISYHDTRSDAIWKELNIQKIFNVVTDNLFVNMAYAAPNGFFGKSDSSRRGSGKYETTKFIFISPCNEVMITIGLLNISEKYKINPSAFHRILDISKNYTKVKGCQIYFYSDKLYEELTTSEDVLFKYNSSYIAVSLDKKIYTIFNTLAQFARDHRISNTMIFDAVSKESGQTGKYKFYKYTNKLYNEILDNVDEYLPTENVKWYIALHNDNRVEKVLNLNQWCILNDIVYSNAKGVYYNTKKQTKGWRFYDYSDKIFDELSKNPNLFNKIPLKGQKVFYFINKDGKTITTETLKDWCLDNSLSYASMLSLNAGNQKCHRGWRKF